MQTAQVVRYNLLGGCKVKLLTLSGLLICMASCLMADRIRIGAWNIQDLHHNEGHSLRDLGGFQTVRRSATDFQLLEKYRDLFGFDGTPADVIALQETGTKAALIRLFPEDEYTTIISSRWQDDNAPPGLGDVYTAIAIRKASEIEILDRDDLLQLAMLGPDGTYTRAGTAVLLKSAATEFWFLSLHLKSGCPKTQKIHQSTSAVCETLWRQGLVLRDWITKKREEAPVILAGDFNRQFRKLEDQFGLWKVINNVDPTDDIEDAIFKKYPQTDTRKCPTKKGNTLQPIDWILVDARLAEQVVAGSYHERRWSREDVEAAQNGRGLSDHCPISIDLNDS